ncbi:MAG: hypothetical protein ACOC4M_14210 [Promethearchaeia archaeon]
MENGNFRASLFSTEAGLVLASQKAEEVDEKVVAAMGSLLSEAAYKAAEEIKLSGFKSMKIKYKEDFIICRNIIINENTQFILAILADIPDSEDVEKYYDQLLDWAQENAEPELKKLAEI